MEDKGKKGVKKGKDVDRYKEILDLASRRSFFYQSAEIYGAYAGFWDYGHYGNLMLNNIINFWRRWFVKYEDMIEINGSIALPKKVFASSGHLNNFNDPIVKCTKCNSIFRVDKLIEEKTKKHISESMSVDEFNKLIKENNIVCPKCGGKLSNVTLFNMMLDVKIGVGKNQIAYLRPETCQSIFVDFNRIYKTNRIKLPVGIAQVGKAFRNEISPRQSILRQIEFNQMEIEIFFDPDKINEFDKYNGVKNYKLRLFIDNKINEVNVEDALKKKIVSGKLIAYYLARVQQFYENLGIKKEDIRLRSVSKDDRPFYSRETWDLEINTCLGWIEVVANNYRQDYDLKVHSKGSNKDLSVTNGKKFIPHVWEISVGLDRTLFILLERNYKKTGDRNVLSLKPFIAPINIGILPLMKKDELVDLSRKIYDKLKLEYNCFYDDSGSIGRRYARLDEIGCPFCITIDYDSLKNNDCTLRFRDTTEQIRIKISDIPDVVRELVKGMNFNDLKKFKTKNI